MKRIIIFTILVTCVLFLTACGSQTLYMCKDGTPGGGQGITSNNIKYICPNGRETDDIGRCTFEKRISVSERDAEKAAVAFVNGFVSSDGWKTSFINAYREDGAWHAQLIISKRDEGSVETIVAVDGLKGTVSCEETCEYTNNN